MPPHSTPHSLCLSYSLYPQPDGSAALDPESLPGWSKLTLSARASGCSSHESASKGLLREGGCPAGGALTALCSEQRLTPGTLGKAFPFLY